MRESRTEVRPTFLLDSTCSDFLLEVGAAASVRFLLVGLAFTVFTSVGELPSPAAGASALLDFFTLLVVLLVTFLG